MTYLGGGGHPKVKQAVTISVRGRMKEHLLGDGQML